MSKMVISSNRRMTSYKLRLGFNELCLTRGVTQSLNRDISYSKLASISISFLPWPKPTQAKFLTWRLCLASLGRNEAFPGPEGNGFGR